METTEKQIEALRELINIGVGKSASILNTMLNSHIILQVPLLRILDISELHHEVKTMGDGKLSTVILKFKGPFSGSAELIFPCEIAMRLVNSLVGENPVGIDLDSIRSGTLCEIGNVVLNGVMGSISNIFSSYFKYSVPEYIEDVPESIFSERVIDFDMKVLLAKTKFIIKELDVDGDIMLFFEVSALDRLIEMLETLPQ